MRSGWIRCLAIAAVIFFLATAFRAGWTRSESDFPNYYTAAVLTRRHAPLRRFYDWAWFQRQMNYAGVERQLGGYIPQTPLTMLPLIPVSGLPLQPAKRVWLIANLGFLAATIWMLSRLTRIRASWITLLAIAGYGSLYTNFLLGQYYVFLLFLLTLAFYFLQREKPTSGGCTMGIAFCLKLYGGPFLLYFAAKRRWKEVAAMAGASLLLALIAVGIFGWRDVAAFATDILPRSLAGETLDPYHPANGTFSTLLRRTVMPEPDLNPHPLADMPAFYFFLQPLVTLAILAFPLLAMARSNQPKRDFAWFVIVLLLASPNTASYTFILLLLPVALLLEDAHRWEQVLLVALYFLVNARLQPRWIWLFPKLWLLLALFLIVGRHYWPLLRFRTAAAAALAVVCVSGLVGFARLHGYSQEPGRRWERIAADPGALYASRPAVLRSGIVYESLGPGHYVLRSKWNDGRLQQYVFDGEAIHPIALSPDGPVQFELVAHGTSTTLLLDPATGQVTPAAAPRQSDTPPPLTSPDGKWQLYTIHERGTEQVRVRNLQTSAETTLTGGNCNSFSPAWELDSKAILFASDCGRGLGLPALYRASLAGL